MLSYTMIGRQTPTILIILIAVVILFFSVNSQALQFSRELSEKDQMQLGLMKRQKLSHLHFFFHDIVSGRNPTAMRVASASVTNSSATGFGAVVVIDDPLTMGPEMSSKVVGRAQGIYALADLSEFGLLMTLNFVFTEGKYNGSTLSVLGRNAPMSAVREMPVVGGSGVLRFARGYAEARTHDLNPKNGNAVVEYNVFVFHY